MAKSPHEKRANATSTQREKREWMQKGDELSSQRRFAEALFAYDQAIHLDKRDPLAYHAKGIALAELQRYEEALVAYEQAIRLDSGQAITFYN